MFDKNLYLINLRKKIDPDEIMKILENIQKYLLL